MCIYSAAKILIEAGQAHSWPTKFAVVVARRCGRNPGEKTGLSQSSCWFTARSVQGYPS
jgi:hypothetical protein